MKTEQRVLQYIRSKQINIALLSAKTGLHERKFVEENAIEWTADEFFRVCTYLGVDPWFFSEIETKKTGKPDKF